MNFSNSVINKICVHFVGNKLQNGKLIVSKKQLHLRAEILERLSNYFLNKFKDSVERFSFTHSSSLKYNEVYNYCKDIFSGERTFLSGAIEIVSHLYEQSMHPKVKDTASRINYQMTSKKAFMACYNEHVIPLQESLGDMVKLFGKWGVSFLHDVAMNKATKLLSPSVTDEQNEKKHSS